VAVLRRVCYHPGATLMDYHVRHLPHWNPGDRTIFLTWRLYGSLPAEVITQLRQQRSKSAGKEFLKADRALDKARAGPLWLNEPTIARCVVSALYRGDRELHQYALKAFAVMPNHVHVLLDPSISLERITNGLKGVTAREANQILGRVGKHFWQDETFDHWIRNGTQYDRVRVYIERNPVAAGLVKNPEDWPWSSASKMDTLGCP
jgi:putative transposase